MNAKTSTLLQKGKEDTFAMKIAIINTKTLFPWRLHHIDSV
jgi:hypothetical protein